MSEGSEEAYVQPKAFEVDDIAPDYSTGPPTSALEYLRRVRQDAGRKSSVTYIESAEIPGYVPERRTEHSVQKVDIAPAPKWCNVDESWETELVEWFAGVRAGVEAENWRRTTRIPGLKDEQGWKRMCFGKASGQVDVVMGMDSVQVAAGVGYFSSWLGEAAEERILKAAEELLIGFRAHWLFALLVRLDLPLSREAAAAVRSILKTLAACRANLESQDDSRLAPLSVFIVLLSKYFGQGV